MPKLRYIYILCFLLALPSCGGGPSVETGLYVDESCIVVAPPRLSPDTIRIALPGPIDPGHAPVAGNESERILFGQIYETLFTLDCRGKAQPALARAWSGTDGDRTWLFEIRDRARFHDGSPVRADDVVRCWLRSGHEPFLSRAGVDSVAAAGERIVAVHLSRPSGDIPAVLSAPQFMVARRERGRLWPLGTGPHGIEPGPVWTGRPHRGTYVARPALDPGAPTLVFLEPGARDPRDLLEGGVDVMITADVDVVEYAVSRPHLAAAPLPWDRSYVLLSTTRVRELRWGRPPAGITRGLSASLALEAVRGTARGHEAPCWWDDLDDCAVLSEGASWRPPLSHSAYSPGRPPRIVYPASDPAARDLAERLLALAAAGPGASSQARQIAAAVPGLAGRDRGPFAEGL
ncbi:MAG: ABC transporter substrate-binding protein, partial [Candidatus Krumholzibacteria bacterium]|nr:ABC transporter substrate-binding protein [Candidatus Krumholzibacteria bacterium]